MVRLVITPSKVGAHEISVAQKLFEHGLHLLLLRLPHQPREAYAHFIEGIASEYRQYIIISEHYELLEKYTLGGIYIPANKKEFIGIPPLKREQLLITAIHKGDEIAVLKGMQRPPDFVLLSPVFDSISKESYPSRYHTENMEAIITDCTYPLLALGGITPQRAILCASMGFDGVAILGDIWEKRGQELAHYLAYPQIEMLSLAGHDPSGGAGILADARVAESLGVRAFTITSMLTVQSEDSFEIAQPCSLEAILRNIELNLKNRSVRVAKIGMMPDLITLSKAIDKLRDYGVTRIIWDPLIRASAGNKQVLNPNRENIEKLLHKLYLITPNIPECEAWFGDTTPELLQNIANRIGCYILLKGGHNHGELSEDILYSKNAPPELLQVARTGHPKHGTGCMLSAAISSLLALGHTLPYACREGQRLVHRAMCSDLGLFPRLDAIATPSRQRKLKNAYHLQYITNSTDSTHLFETCRAYLEGGGRWIQLRVKSATTSERVALAIPLIALAHQYDAVFLINDDVDAALLANADGVHLGKDDLCPLKARSKLGWDKIIGATCNTPDDLQQAYRYGCDYVGIGPYRHTTTKKRLAPILGLTGIKELTQAMNTFAHPMPTIAIGGIDLKDIRDIMTTSISGIAISGAIEQSPDISMTTQQFVELITEHKHH